MNLNDDRSKKVGYDPKSFTIDKLREVISAMYTTREPYQPVILHTGIGGMYTFDYLMGLEYGVLKPYMTKKHGRLMRIIGMGLRLGGKVVDENGIVWMVGWVKDKGFYFSNMHEKAPIARKEHKRFNTWEWSLAHGLPPELQPWPSKYADTYAYYKEKHDTKAEAKRSGQRRKGTVDPQDYWKYHG